MEAFLKTPRFVFLIAVLILVLLAVQTPQPAQAQGTLSPMCIFLNGRTYATVIAAGFGGAGFNPGEVVTISHTGTAPFVTVEAPNGTLLGTIPAGGTASFAVPTAATNLWIKSAFGPTATIAGTIQCGFAPPSGGDGGSEVKFYDPGDDRLNREPGQPAALYCRNQGDVHIYSVNPDDSKGTLVLVITKAEIDAVINANPTANTLIKQSPDGKFRLFYLPATKELSFVTAEARSGKPYTFVWKALCR
jgi:hypothetical protein